MLVSAGIQDVQDDDITFSRDHLDSRLTCPGTARGEQCALDRWFGHAWLLPPLTVVDPRAARVLIQENHSARDQFKESILDLAALCANLRRVDIPDTREEPKRAHFQAERDRWEAHIGDITTWLIDHWQRYAVGYVGPAEFSNLITRYAADARRLDIGQATEDRVCMLQDTNGLMLTIFVGR